MKHPTKAESLENIILEGYLMRSGQWQAVPVKKIPIWNQLFSRTKGVIETDILIDKKVMIIGLGSVGAPITIELAKTSVSSFTLVDHDQFEVGNVCRHLAGLSDIGRYKTKYVSQQIREKNPTADVHTFEMRGSWDNTNTIREIVRESDLVICGADDISCRRMINMICVQEKKTVIIPGAYRRAYGGQVLVIRPGETLCYECFLEMMPERAADEEISNQEQADRIAYSDKPVPVEPGLSIDIAPISQMAAKLAHQQLLREKETTLRSLDEDLSMPWYIWWNRREVEGQSAKFTPLGNEIDGLHIMRWYGITAERNPACPVCGDFVGLEAQKLGIEISAEDLDAFRTK